MIFALSAPFAGGQIDEDMFRHHFIAKQLPGKNLGMGSPALADFDRDGDLDFAVLNRGDLNLYWFENSGGDSWRRHLMGKAVRSQLGSAVLDVDQDGWTDLVIGGYWYQNSQAPRSQPLRRDVVQDVERVVGCALVVFVVGDQAAAVVG